MVKIFLVPFLSDPENSLKLGLNQNTSLTKLLSLGNSFIFCLHLGAG